MTEAYRAEFADLVNGYLDHVGRRVLRSLPAPHKLAYYLVRIRAMPQLAELAAWLMEQPVRQVPMVRRWGRLRADLPFGPGWPGPPPPADAPRHRRSACRPACSARTGVTWTRTCRSTTSAGPMTKGAERQSGKRDRLVVTGRANVPSVDIARRRNTSKIVILRPPGPGIRRLPVVRPARSFLHPEATALSEQDRYNYDWSGFRFTVSPRWLRGTGEWQCYMLVRGHGVWRPARVHTPVPGPAERPQPRQVAPGLRFGARWAGLGLNVARWRLGAVVAALAWPDADTRAAEIEVEVPAGSATFWRPGRVGAGTQPGRGHPLVPGGPGGIPGRACGQVPCPDSAGRPGRRDGRGGPGRGGRR